MYVFMVAYKLACVSNTIILCFPMQHCQHDLEHALPLNSHLIKPVQRILKYNLLLQVHAVYVCICAYDSERVDGCK